MKQGGIVWSGSQYARGHRDQRDMSGDRRQVPHLSRLGSSRVALFVIDVNGPAVASKTREAVRLPVPCVGDAEQGRIRKVCLSVVHDDALLPNVRATMGVARTVVDRLLTCVGERNVLNDRGMTWLKGVTMRRLPFASKGLEAFCSWSQE